MLFCCPAIPKMWPLFCAIQDNFSPDSRMRRGKYKSSLKNHDSEVTPFTSIHISFTSEVTDISDTKEAGKQFLAGNCVLTLY